MKKTFTFITLVFLCAFSAAEPVNMDTLKDRRERLRAIPFVLNDSASDNSAILVTMQDFKDLPTENIFETLKTSVPFINKIAPFFPGINTLSFDKDALQKEKAYLIPASQDKAFQPAKINFKEPCLDNTYDDLILESACREKEKIYFPAVYTVNNVEITQNKDSKNFGTMLFEDIRSARVVNVSFNVSSMQGAMLNFLHDPMKILKKAVAENTFKEISSAGKKIVVYEKTEGDKKTFSYFISA